MKHKLHAIPRTEDVLPPPRFIRHNHEKEAYIYSDVDP